ncbi:hypothetical protein CALCODRAFT_517458 [Calocera cornea HHB12733]|uniref:Uncharacterized protein n=1 Tax=Calocera cornea HHB12733 TaxID=1353952 RepID=A0A165G231_9BASI|nr:hypothetical protein CALCODRAFT_517458 [Calocera cornea HHB12733]
MLPLNLPPLGAPLVDLSIAPALFIPSPPTTSTSTSTSTSTDPPTTPAPAPDDDDPLPPPSPRSSLGGYPGWVLNGGRHRRRKAGSQARGQLYAVTRIQLLYSSYPTYRTFRRNSLQDSMPFATAKAGLRFTPVASVEASTEDELAEAAKRDGDDELGRAQKKKTVEDLLAAPSSSRYDYAPTINSLRKDSREAAMLSVEHIPLVRYSVPDRTPEEAAADRRFLDRLERIVGGHGDSQHDIVWVKDEHDSCLWARSRRDWTVWAQDFDKEFPHRPYCEGPPAHPLNAKVWWIPLIRNAFSPSSDAADAVGIINLRWVAHLKRVHDIFLDLGKFRLLRMPSCDVPKRYSPLTARWAAKIDWSDLGRPMSYRQASQAWLLAQCKIRDLLGMVNFFDSHYLRHMPRGLDNAPWVFNFVGVTHESLPDGPTRQVLMRDGVPVLEAEKKRKDDGTWTWKDVCHTDDYVLEERRQLKKEGKAPGTQVNQCRHPESLPLDKGKTRARPNQHVRRGGKNAEASGSGVSSTVRKSMRAGVQEFAERPLLPDMLDKRRQATWKDTPALYPGREIQPLPQAMGGATSTAYAPIQPPPLSKAFPKHDPSWGPTPWASIAEPYRTHPHRPQQQQQQQQQH